MQELKKWAEKYKQLCVMLGIFGLLLSPFLWPFFLAILLNSLSIALPVLIVWTIVEWTRKEKKDGDEKNRGQDNEANASKDAADDVFEEYTENKTDAENNPVPKGEQKRHEPVIQKKEHRTGAMDEESCAAISWYHMEGRERIFRLMKRLETEGIYTFSVTPEGLCTVKEDRGFRRVSVLRAFPRHRIRVVEREIRKDGIRVNTNGKYLWLSWGRRGSK